MSPKEGIYYAVWMATIICTVFVCNLLGINRIIGLIGGVVLGIGLGSLAESWYTKSSAARSNDPVNPYNSDKGQTQVLEPGDVACSNPNCRWVGPSREHVHCPKCRQPIH